MITDCSKNNWTPKIYISFGMKEKWIYYIFIIIFSGYMPHGKIFVTNSFIYTPLNELFFLKHLDIFAFWIILNFQCMLKYLSTVNPVLRQKFYISFCQFNRPLLFFLVYLSLLFFSVVHTVLYGLVFLTIRFIRSY